MSKCTMMTRRSNLIVLCIISMAVLLVPIGGVRISHLKKQTYVYSSLSGETLTAREGTNPPNDAALDQERTKRMATLTDIPFAQVILPKGNKPYWLKKGAVVSHATAFPFITFKDHSPTWFSPDPTEGLRLIIGNELQAQTDKGTPPRDIFIKRCTVQRDVALFPMSPTDQESKDRLLALGMTEDDFVWFNKHEQNGPKLQPMGGWYSKTAEATDRFISNFCAKLKGKFEGWRNAFDQDEIMICDEVNAKVQCSTQIPSLPPTTKSEGWICPATRPGVYAAGLNGAINTNALKTVGYSQLIVQGYSPRAPHTTSHPFFLDMIKDYPVWDSGFSKTNRMTYAVVPITQYNAFSRATFDHQASMDQSSVILTEVCTFTDHLNTELTRRMNGGPQVFQDAAIKGARQAITSKRGGYRAASKIQLRLTDTVDKSQNFLKEIKRTAASASMLPSCDYEANPQGPPVQASTPQRAVAVLLANARDPNRAQRIICYVPRTPDVVLTVGALKVSVESAYRSFINNPKANLDGWFTSLTDPKLKGLQFPIYKKNDLAEVGAVIYAAKQ